MQMEPVPQQELKQPESEDQSETPLIIDRTRPMMQGQGILGGVGLGYKCDSDTGKCTCNSAQDCLDMGRADVCEGVTRCGDQIPERDPGGVV
jgi:hypothetical protein